MTEWKDAIVVGAGISGLTAAYQLKKQGIRVTVLDAGKRAGGLINTVDEGGFLVENGPQTFAPGRSPELMELINEFNMDLEPANEHAKKRYLFLNGKLEALPTSPSEALASKVLSWPGKFRILQELWQAPFSKEDMSGNDEISVDTFFRKRFGDEVADRLVNPFISGIYAGDPRKLSLPSVFPSLWDMYLDTGSILKTSFLKFREAKTEKRKALRENPELAEQPALSKHALYSLKRGLQYLPLTMARQISDCQFGVTVTHIESERSTYTLTLDDGKKLKTNKLVLAVPAFTAAQLIDNFAPLAAEALLKIPYISIAVAHIGFIRSDIEHPLDGFGFLVPETARMALLGSVWASSLFPDRSMEQYVLLSNYMGGSRNPQLALQNPDEIVELACRDLSIAFRSKSFLKPAFSQVIRHTRGIPQYTIGHRTHIKTTEWDLAKHPNLALCGNYLNGIPLNDCVKSGMQAAERILQLNSLITT
jgi:protoporphyrinogen/coproporphyrinogen III oxidase